MPLQQVSERSEGRRGVVEWATGSNRPEGVTTELLVLVGGGVASQVWMEEEEERTAAAAW